MLAIEKNKQIVERIGKLSKRIDTIDNLKLTFVEFLIKYYNFYSSHCKVIKSNLQNFQDIISKKSFYSIGKCREIKNFISTYKHFCVFIESVSKVNATELKRIDFDMVRQEDNLRRKSQEFIKNVWEYSKDEENSNHIFEDYNGNCSKLEEMMIKFKSYEDPIIFYSLNTATDFSKKLDRKFHQCENSQTNVVNNLQILDQKRKLLSENLKDIKEDYVLLFHNHIVNIENVAQCLIDESTDQMYENMKTVKVFGGMNEGDVFNQQIQRFDDKYGSKNQSQEYDLFNDLKQLFGDKNASIQISSDYKLFLDRCQSFLKNKYQYTGQTLEIQRRTLKEIQSQIENCIKIDQDYQNIEREIFKSDGIDNFKKMLGKYFGEDILSISELCLYIADNPKKRFEKIGKILQRHKDQIFKIIDSKQEEFKTFKKRMELILGEHQTMRNSLKNSQDINPGSISKFNVNVEKTFQHFKKNLQQFSRSEEYNDNIFNNELSKISTEIKRQASHSLLGYILGREKKEREKVEFLHRMNVDSIIIGIVKSDARYQVLFHDQLKSDLFSSFKSVIQRKKFEETKKIIKKKQYQEKAFSGQRSIGCCGLQNKKVPKFKPISAHRGHLRPLKDHKSKQEDHRGEISILQKGLMFEQKTRNPFSQKVLLIIPAKEIISVRVANLNEENIIQILTNMGIIQFMSSDFNEIHDSLEKILNNKTAIRDDDSRRDRVSDTSSFLKHNNSSTQYKISVDSGFGNKPIQHSKNYKAPPVSLILEQLTKKLYEKKFLCDKFQHTKIHESNKRHDYHFKDAITKFTLKERRDQQSQQQRNSNELNFKFQWKITFPQMPMLKSFRHLENIKVILEGANQVEIVIIEKHREDSHLFVRKIFFSEIDKMNKQICDFIAHFCDRDAQVKIEQQGSELQTSTNLDIQEIGLNIKQDVFMKSESQRASRIMFPTETER